MSYREAENTYESLYIKGQHEAGWNFKDEGAFHNPYIRHTPEWVGYHAAESKQYREDLNNSHYQQEPY